MKFDIKFYSNTLQNVKIIEDIQIIFSQPSRAKHSVTIFTRKLISHRRWICGFCETAPDEVRLRDQAEPTAFTDPPPQPEEAATPT